MCEYDFKAFHLQLLQSLADIFVSVRVRELHQHEVRAVHGEDLPLPQPFRGVLPEVDFRPQVHPESVADLRGFFPGDLQLFPEYSRSLPASAGMMVRGRDDITDPVLISHPEHLLHFLRRLCSVVHAENDMAVCINKSFHLIFLLKCHLLILLTYYRLCCQICQYILPPPT